MHDTTEAHILNVQTYIDEQGFRPYHWLILVLGFLIVAVDGFDTAAIGYVAPSLVQEWSISKTDLGPVLTAALVGLAIGGIAGGPVADRLGRKLVLVVSVFFFGVWSLVSAYATSLEALTLFRFLTGLGLGAAMPNAVTMMSEFAPKRFRSMLVNTMFCGFPLGASAGGFLAAGLIPAYGWRAVLVVGGVTPLILSVFLFLLLPESLRFLVARKHSAEKIRGIIQRIYRENFATVTEFITHEPQHEDAKLAVGVVFSKRYLLGSIMLWAAYFFGLVIIYLLINWMPLILKDAGFSVGRAAFISALFTLGGGIGAIASGWMMGRFDANKVVAATYGLTALLLFAVGLSIGNAMWLGILLFIMGIAMNGAQVSMPTLATEFYPTQSRSTGVAWMMGVGRLGGISGALFGAELMRQQLGFDQIFTILTIPAFLAAGALILKYQAVSSAARTEAPVLP